MTKSILSLPNDYSDWLSSLKKRIHGARQRALLAATESHLSISQTASDLFDAPVSCELDEIDTEWNEVTVASVAMIGALSQ